MKYEEAKNLVPREFKRLCGVYPETFNQMVKILQEEQKQKKVAGRPSKLSLENQILITLEYLREYRTYFHIGKTWGINESTAFRIIRKVEEALIKSEEFKLPGKKELLETDYPIKTIVIDVTESPVERPKKTEEILLRQKKSHTIKSQVVINQETGSIICTKFDKGKKHDFKIFKQSKLALK